VAECSRRSLRSEQLCAVEKREPSYVLLKVNKDDWSHKKRRGSFDVQRSKLAPTFEKQCTLPLAQWWPYGNPATTDPVHTDQTGIYDWERFELVSVAQGIYAPQN